MSAQVRLGYKQTEVGVIPEDWEVYPVRQVGNVLTGKALAVNAPGQARPYLRTKNVFDGWIVIDDVLLNEGQSLEPRHSEGFMEILGKHCPTWREARAELNELPLTAQVWKE